MKQLNAMAATTFSLCLALIAQAQDCQLTATIQLTPPTCGEYADGSLEIIASGGTPSYTYFLNGAPQAGSTFTGLIAGYYDYWVNDAAGCWFKADFTLECEEEEENCQFRTQTQGGWGAIPNGNNPATYLQSHFASCFPNGVTIGCLSGNTLTLTTSTAVKNFLPSGSIASLLPSDLVNPGGGYNNVLAGQLVAATINVTVDACDPDFSPATGWLGDAVYVGGPFDGQSVASVIDAANDFIGGCGGSNTAAQFNVALTDLNENYANGTIDNGKIACSKKEETKAMTGQTSSGMHVFPNPSTDRVTMKHVFQNIGMGSIVLSDLSGRVVTEQLVNVQNEGMQSIQIDVAGLNAGTYVVTLLFDGTTISHRVVVSK